MIWKDLRSVITPLDPILANDAGIKPFTLSLLRHHKHYDERGITSFDKLDDRRFIR